MSPALVTFVVYIIGVLLIAAYSNKLLSQRSFMSEYFLGSRGLGTWAFALTFAATSASGGSFTGFPSKVYSHGWILALWIGSYMVVPICTMGLIGKRLNQVARKTGAITVPDVLRDRFRTPSTGLTAMLLIIFFMSINLIAQFKAGSLILQTLLDDVPLFHAITDALRGVVAGIPLLAGIEPAYLLCLLVFGIVVVVYTTYGGFHAVVWTDVMQGVVMVIGVIIMLPLALSQVGGLTNATKEMSRMVPPRSGTAMISLGEAVDEPIVIRRGDWGRWDGDAERGNRIFRFSSSVVLEGDAGTHYEAPVLEIRTPEEVARLEERWDTLSTIPTSVAIERLNVNPYASHGDNDVGAYVTGPGPSSDSTSGFLPLSLAISFFFMWAISGTGQPSNMVRLMAFRDTKTLRNAIVTVAIYYTMIYFPIVIIFCCSRILLPGMEFESDRVMPQTAMTLTQNIGQGWLAGLLIAAPFAAVMSTVDSFLLMISSAIVRDCYQRNINPDVSEKGIKRLTYWTTMLVGTAAMIGALNPPQFLQDIIVYTGSGLAACFLAPMIYTLYVPRANLPGVLAGMIGGFGVHLGMYVAGIFANGSFFRPYALFDLDPVVIGLAASFLITEIVTRIAPAPPQDLVDFYFRRRRRDSSAVAGE